MQKNDIEKKAEEIAGQVISDTDFELVDVEYVKEGGEYYLRIFADKEGGITVDDCELISRSVETELDREDFIDEAYILEVSSPGLTRPLKKEKDYIRNRDKLIEIHLYTPVDGIKVFTGLLKNWDEDTVSVEIENNIKVFEKSNISLIRQTFEW